MESVKRVPIVQQVVYSVKKYLFSGSVQVGDKLPVEKDLCEELQVGRGTVREAFRYLEATGYVELRPGKGAFAARTREIGPEERNIWLQDQDTEIVELVELWLAIGPVSVRLAAYRCSEQGLSQLNQIHESFLEAVKLNDAAQIALYNSAFLEAVVKNSKNSQFLSITRQLISKMDHFYNLLFQTAENVEHACLLQKN